MTDYSIERYRSIMVAARDAGYRCISFIDDPAPGSLYLRHDVDYSPQMALQLARVNADLGLVGTFCLLLRSQIYNLLSAETLARVREIQNLGQLVALHVAPPPASVPDIASYVKQEFDNLKAAIPTAVPAFSWHNPPVELTARGLDLDVPGLVNMYGQSRRGAVTYISDSNMRHTPAALEEATNDVERPALQMLLHPIVWVAGGADMHEALASAWGFIIRECEEGMQSNVRYGAAFPDGMPVRLIDEFSARWLSEARKVESE